MGLQNWWKNVSWDVAQRRRVRFVAPASRAENQKRRDTLITADFCSILSFTSRLSVTSTGPAVAQKHMAWPKWPSWTPSNWPLSASALSPCTRWGEPRTHTAAKSIIIIQFGNTEKKCLYWKWMKNQEIQAKCITAKWNKQRALQLSD